MITSQTLGTTLHARHAGGTQVEMAVALVHSAADRHKNDPDEALLGRHTDDADGLARMLDLVR